VDCEDVNNIIVKYRHLILRIYDMLDELHCSYILMKIELKCGYHQIKMKKMMNEKLFLKLNMVYMNGWLCCLVSLMH
jgi:hypothetical protein